MNFTPYEYQQFAINRITNSPVSGLFLDMGLGKTVITLTAINDLMLDRFEVSKVLVIAPLRVAKKVWSDELQKWDHLKHLKISIVVGSAKKRIQALQEKANVYVINRENVEWLIDNTQKWDFDMVVIDELSSFKSSKSNRFRQLRKVRPLIKRIVGLTGTPTPNGLIDLWSQVYLLDLGERLHKTKGAYQTHYFNPGEGNGHVVFKWYPKPGAQEAIFEKLSDICVSMKAVDYISLPDRVDNVIKVQLSREEKALYERLERDRIIQVIETGGHVVAGFEASLSNKLLQMANGAVYDDGGQVAEIHQAKLEALEEIIDTAGQPVLVFYNYKHDRARIKTRIKNARDLETDSDIDDWNSGNIPVMLAHPASCGHGLNLQAGGNIVVWFGLTWSLEPYQQANARLHRQGQRNAVIIHHLVAEGTIDEDVMKALEKKDRTQEALLEAVKARIEKYQKGDCWI